jgi:hypothetical protein
MLTGCALTPEPAAPPPSNPPPASAWNSQMDAGANLWRAKVRGKYKAATSSTPGTKLRFNSDLGLDRREYQDVYHFVYHLDTNWHLFLEFFNYDESGDGLLDRTAWVSGQEIAQWSPLSTDMDIKTLNLMARYKLYHYRGINYGLGVGLLGVEGDSKIFAQQSQADVTKTDVTIKDDWSLLVPTVGGWWKYLSRSGLELALDGRGTWIAYKHSRAKYIDATAYVAYYFMDNFAAYGAYRYAWLDGKDDDVSFEILLQGPALGFWFKF